MHAHNLLKLLNNNSCNTAIKNGFGTRKIMELENRGKRLLEGKRCIRLYPTFDVVVKMLVIYTFLVLKHQRIGSCIRFVNLIHLCR